MKIYIFCDLEGISGIFGTTYILDTAGRPDHLAKGREYMAADINACIEGCFQAGATEVVVRDGHGGGFNVDRSMIDDRATLVSGQTPGVRFAELENSDGIILLGYHGMAGTAGAVLEHTFSSKGIQNISINGRNVGEIYIDAIIAGDHGVPVLMVSGDDKTCQEAIDFLGEDVVTCQTKKGTSSFGAVMPPLSVTRKLITEKAYEAVKKVGEIAPTKVQYPVVWRYEAIERNAPPRQLHHTFIDARTSQWETNCVEEALLFGK
jgi:D-amino peptidase